MSKESGSNDYIALSIENEAKNAELELIAAINQSKLFEMCYAKKYRVKNESSLVEKVRRKIEVDKKTSYEIQNITDVIGLRCVTLFRNEMAEIFDKLMQLIHHVNPLNPNPFCKGAVDEVVIYLVKTNDPVSQCIIDICKKYSSSINPRINDTKSDYSSIHVLSRLNHCSEKLNKIMPGYMIPIEIQIRTVFEDAWGEIDHKYGYVTRRSSGDGAVDVKSDHINDHLKILKKFTDACADYANQIHIEYNNIRVDRKATKETVIMVDSDDEAVTEFAKNKISQERVDSYLKSVERMNAAEKMIGFKRVEYLVASSKEFSALVENVKMDNISEGEFGEYLYYYYSKMNEAICLMSSLDNGNIQAASNIYMSLEQKYDDFPLLKMRLGQSLGKLNNSKVAVEKLYESYNLIKGYEKDKLVGSYQVPKSDYKHIKENLPALLGYEIWKSTRGMARDTDEEILLILEKLQEACTVTFERDRWIGEEKKCYMYNNLLYFSLDKIKLIDSMLNQSDEILEQKHTVISDIKYNILALENEFVPDKAKDIDVLDTLAKGYFFLERFREAKKLGSTIMSLILQPQESDLLSSSLKDEIQRETWEMICEIDKRLES